MNARQPTPSNYSGSKVEGGRLAVARFKGEGKEDVIVTYWGSNGVFERACYLLKKYGDNYRTHLQHTETGTYDSKGVKFNCYNEDGLPPKLKENVPTVQKMLEEMLSE